MNDKIDRIIEVVLENSIVEGVCSCCADGDVYAVVDTFSNRFRPKSDYDKCREELKSILDEGNLIIPVYWAEIDGKKVIDEEAMREKFERHLRGFK